ncbi:hypothetical protein [Roseateles sp.]|uniref:hypothetical protein n=1 Tax=Roseateles sp. TaxID=1971397 RepID=UPI002600BF6E|nr:hypothetical protein [Roseateles sp.]MBV8035996.1 hypothetical protein [Roseateles sp.]
MTTHRFSPAFLLALAAMAGSAQAATVAAHARATPPAVARSLAQGQRIDAELRHGRLTLMQANALQDARAMQEQQARSLAAGPSGVAAALVLSHEQDRLDWAIHSGNTQFLSTHGS